MVHAEVCVHMHAPMNTRAKVPEHFSSIMTHLTVRAESFMKLAFQLGGPASCAVCLRPNTEVVYYFLQKCWGFDLRSVWFHR